MEKYANNNKDVKRTIVNEGIVRFGERLKEAMNGESNYSLAKRCCISEGLLRKYIKGISYPALDNLVSLSIALDKPIEWLAIGSLQSNSTPSVEQCDPDLQNPLLQKWIDIFSVINEADQKIAINNIIKNGIKTLLIDVDTKEQTINADDVKQAVIDLLINLNDKDIADALNKAKEANYKKEMTA